MTGHHPRPDSMLSPPFAADVVAAGKGVRAGGSVPKQFAQWHGKPLLRHSVEALVHAGASPIVVAIPDGWHDEAVQALDGIAAVRLVTGGATRQDSVRAALETLAIAPPQHVLIHDAARPDLPAAVIHRLIAALDANLAAIPVLPVVDSVVRGGDGLRDSAVSREGLYRVQTPQAFRYEAILNAHSVWIGAADAGDDAEVASAAGVAVTLVEGDERVRKVTFASDFEDGTLGNTLPRTGMGFDGHSDADVAIHALVDALLGAIAAGDIGDHFPPSDPQWKGASSDRFLAHAAHLVRQSGHAIGNVDVTIICEEPKIGPHKTAMRARLAAILGIDSDCVSVKATTTERLGATGRGEGIAAQAIATVVPCVGV